MTAWSRSCAKEFLIPIDSHEFCSFDSLNLDFTPTQIDFLVDAIDSDGSKSIEYGEWCQTMELTDTEMIGQLESLGIENDKRKHTGIQI